MTYRMAWPAARIPFKTLNSWATSSSPRLAVGSSRISTPVRSFQLPSTRAIATLLLSTAESSPAGILTSTFSHSRCRSRSSARRSCSRQETVLYLVRRNPSVSATLSITLRESTSPRSWWTHRIGTPSRSPVMAPRTSSVVCPPTVTVAPRSGNMTPLSVLMRVDLPDPFVPSRRVDLARIERYRDVVECALSRIGLGQPGDRQERSPILSVTRRHRSLRGQCRAARLHSPTPYLSLRKFPCIGLAAVCISRFACPVAAKFRRRAPRSRAPRSPFSLASLR